MKESSYLNLLQFTNQLITDNLKQSSNAAFIENTIERLHQFFGFDTVCMASLSNSGKKEISSNFVTSQKTYPFIQKLITAQRFNPYFLDTSSDINLLSSRPDYKKTLVYQDLLRPFGYTDMILQFIHPEGNEHYLSCILYLSDKDTFTAKTEELLQLLNQPIANAHLDNINTNRLICRINKISDTINYYPAGILYISADHKIVQTNAIARQYLADFGITDSYLYDTFFTNNIYTYYMRAIRSRTSPLPLRIGDYLFSVVTTSNIMDNSCPAYQIFDSELNHYEDDDLLLNSVDNAVASVYIIHSEQQQVLFSENSLTTLGLTRREAETAEFIAKGLSNTEIASAMDISENTVKTHLANIYKKLGLNYRTELMSLLHKMNL